MNKVIIFTANWSGASKSALAQFKNLKSQVSTDSVEFLAFDINKNQDEAVDYNVLIVPTLIFIKDGQVTETIYGKSTFTQLSQIYNSIYS